MENPDAGQGDGREQPEALSKYSLGKTYDSRMTFVNVHLPEYC